MPSSISAFKVTATLVTLVIGLLAVDRGGAMLLRDAYGRSTSSPEQLVLQVRPETIVIGASTAKYAFHPAAWKGKLLNLAQDGQSVVFSFALFAALPQVESLRRVVMVIDPENLKLGLDNPAAPRVWRIAPLIAEHPEIEAALSQRKSADPLAWSHLYRYRGTIEDIAKRLVRPESSVYQPLDPGPLPENVALRADAGSPATIHPSLDALLALQAPAAARLGVQLVFVAPLFYKGTWSNDDKALFLQLAQRLKAAGAPVCHLLDLATSELRDIQQTPAYFHDLGHFAEAGARAYSVVMEREIDARCPLR